MIDRSFCVCFVEEKRMRSESQSPSNAQPVATTVSRYGSTWKLWLGR
jgi:hypothetical protein